MHLSIRIERWGEFGASPSLLVRTKLEGSVVDCRERVSRALRLEPTDRLPLVGGFIRHPRFLADTAGVTLAEFWQQPKKTAIQAFRRLGADVIIGLILPDRKSETYSQVMYRNQTRFHSPEDVKEYVESLPPPESVKTQFDSDAVRKQCSRDVVEGQTDCGDIVWIPNGVHRFCVVFDFCSMFGYDNYLMALALYPDTMERLFARDAERAFLTNQILAEVISRYNTVPCVWTGTDACDNRGPFVRTETMEEIYFPYLQYALSPLRKADIRIIWHSDGNITPIVPALLAAGVDGFQGLQEKTEICVDVGEIDRLRTLRNLQPLFVGSISSTVTMPFGTSAEVRQEVQRWATFAQKRGGGVLLNFSSSLGPEVPVDNIRAFYKAGLQIRTEAA